MVLLRPGHCNLQSPFNQVPTYRLRSRTHRLHGGEAAANDSHIALGIVFSVFGSFSIGWLENICIVGAPLHVDAKNLGIASGLQMSLRVVMSSLASMSLVYRRLIGVLANCGRCHLCDYSELFQCRYEL